MIYRTTGVFIQNNEMAISFSEFQENAGAWTCELKIFSVFEYHIYSLGSLINKFISENNLQFQVAIVSVFAEDAELKISGAAIAAETALPVITGLNEMDIKLGGNGDFLSYSASKLGFGTGALSDVQKSQCIALLGILRWREEYNFLSSITGASRNNIGGAVWLGQAG